MAKRSMSPRVSAATGALMMVATLAATQATNSATASAPAHSPRDLVPKSAVSVVIGQTAGTTAGCSPANFTALLKVEDGAPSYVVPATGVLTRVSTRANAVPGAFRVLAYSGPGPVRTLVANSGLLTLTPSTLNTIPVRLPVPAGARLAFNAATSGVACALTSVAAGDQMVSQVVNPDTTSTFTDGNALTFRPNISAVWETDDDGDGYGDVSQDACPQSALAHDPCPAPETVLAKKPKRSTTQRKVTITFGSSIAGSTFRCGLDGKAAKPCSSPYRVKVRLGKHTVAVTAVSPAGVADTSPAAVTFKVKPKPKH